MYFCKRTQIGRTKYQILVDFVKENRLVYQNTNFQKRKIPKWAFLYQNNEREQLDYILMNRKKIGH